MAGTLLIVEETSQLEELSSTRRTPGWKEPFRMMPLDLQSGMEEEGNKEARASHPPSHKGIQWRSSHKNSRELKRKSHSLKKIPPLQERLGVFYRLLMTFQRLWTPKSQGILLNSATMKRGE